MYTLGDMRWCVEESESGQVREVTSGRLGDRQKSTHLDHEYAWDRSIGYVAPVNQFAEHRARRRDPAAKNAHRRRQFKTISTRVDFPRP